MNVKVGRRTIPHRTVRYDPHQNALFLIEQRLLPHQFQIVTTRTYLETARAIRDMIVRGAGAIGATAAFGLAQGVLAYGRKRASQRDFRKHVQRVFQTLKSARPTAVDPVNAMNGVLASMARGETIAEQQALAVEAAEQFAEEDVAHCRAIGEWGLPLIRPGAKVLTHCNAGWLAFVDIGSATAPLYAAQACDRSLHVFCSETRPRCQGATLTAWELANQGLSHQIVSDNACGHLMQRGLVDLVIVGSDRTLGRTGEVANKIGTYMKAVLAHRHHIPFYVAIPLSTIDWNLSAGMQIPIEERHSDEYWVHWGLTDRGRREHVRVANSGSDALNPGFDVTPAELITGIITPVGVFKPRELWSNRRKLSGPL